MLVPRLEIDLDKIAHNARALMAICSSKGIALTAVTKGVCGSPEIAHVLVKSGIDSIGDSHVANIHRMQQAGVDAKFMLVRSPQPSEAQEVVRLIDVSLDTEMALTGLLADAAQRLHQVHSIILMVELGDLREGLLPDDLDAAVERVLAFDSLRLAGIGTNLACFGGIKPTKKKMEALSSLTERIEAKFGLSLQMVSGGNSANFEWLQSSASLGRVNHLRVGEAILLGRETTARSRIPGLWTDAFTLLAEVIEVKTKPSMPWGQRVQNALGHYPAFRDTGHMKRALVAIGRQDIEPDALQPQIAVRVLGATSDHLVLDATGCDLQVGDQVRFGVGYSALLRAMISPYVEKVYLSTTRQSQNP